MQFGIILEEFLVIINNFIVMLPFFSKRTYLTGFVKAFCTARMYVGYEYLNRWFTRICCDRSATAKIDEIILIRFLVLH